MKKRWIGVVALALVAACGGAPPPAASAPAPAVVDAPAPSATSAPTSSSAEPAGDQERARAVTADEKRVDARSELDAAVHDFLAASSDCAAACRALASMERATQHLCDLAKRSNRDDDRSACDDARQKVASASARIRHACTACPPDAPRDSSPAP